MFFLFLSFSFIINHVLSLFFLVFLLLFFFFFSFLLLFFLFFDLSEFLFSLIFVCKMCFFCFTFGKTLTETHSETKSWKSSRILRLNPMFFHFSSFFQNVSPFFPFKKFIFIFFIFLFFFFIFWWFLRFFIFFISHFFIFFIFLHFLFFYFLSFSFMSFHFVGCSKSFFWASISLRFLLTVLM